MTEKQSHSGNGAPQTLQDWPTLVGRAVDDVTRILQSEAHMLETSMSAALQVRLAAAITTLTVVAVMLSGGVCILCAAILLIHQWLQHTEKEGWHEEVKRGKAVKKIKRRRGTRKDKRK